MTLAPARPVSKTQTIRNLLAAAPDGMTCREIVNATGYKPNTVGGILFDLIERGDACTPVVEGRGAKQYRLNSLSGKSRRMGRVYYAPGRQPSGQPIPRKQNQPRPAATGAIAAPAPRAAKKPEPQLVVRAPKIVTGLIEITSDYGRVGRFVWYNSMPASQPVAMIGESGDLVETRIIRGTRFGDAFFDSKAESAWFSHLE